MQNRSLHVANRQQVLQGFAAAAGMSNEAEPIGTSAGEHASRLHDRMDVPHRFRVSGALQWRDFREGIGSVTASAPQQR